MVVFFLSFQFLNFYFPPPFFAQTSVTSTVLDKRDDGDILVSFPILGISFSISPLNGMFALDVLEIFFIYEVKEILFYS